MHVVTEAEDLDFPSLRDSREDDTIIMLIQGLYDIK